MPKPQPGVSDCLYNALDNGAHVQILGTVPMIDDSHLRTQCSIRR